LQVNVLNPSNLQEVIVINRLLVFVALVVMTCACSSAKNPNPIAPSGTLGKLTVAIVSDSGAPLAGTVSVFEGNRNVGTKFVEAGSNAVFADLASGTYRVTAVSEFYQTKETSFTIENREEALRLDLTPVPYDIRLIEVLANGQTLKPGEVVAVPTNLTFKVRVMNGVGSPLAAQVRVFGDPILEKVGVGTSSMIQPGLQEVMVTIPNFRACTDAGACFDRSKLVFLYVGDYPYQGAAMHREIEVPMVYAR
jgi:hypothetical protein